MKIPKTGFVRKTSGCYIIDAGKALDPVAHSSIG